MKIFEKNSKKVLTKGKKGGNIIKLSRNAGRQVRNGKDSMNWTTKKAKKFLTKAKPRDTIDRLTLRGLKELAIL